MKEHFLNIEWPVFWTDDVNCRSLCESKDGWVWGSWSNVVAPIVDKNY